MKHNKEPIKAAPYFFYISLINIQKIISAFENVSQDIEEIWTLEGFKNHPFWIGQRELANILLEKLNHVII